MSIKVMTYVWDHSPHTGSDLLMLLALADHANDQGKAWPSIPTLAKKSRVGKRQAIYIIQKLEKAGSISIEHGVGRGHVSVYTIKGATECTNYQKGATECTIPEEKVHPSAPFREEKVHSSVIKGAVECTRTIIEPSLRENLDTNTHAREKKVGKRSSIDYTPGYLQFWDSYPHERRASKPTCFGVWRAADLEQRTTEICEKIERLKATSWRDCQPTYIPMTTTWLNQGRYEDDLMPLPHAVLAGGRLNAREHRTAAATQRILEENLYGSSRPTGLSRRVE